jgi:hypothetical protein
MMVIGPDGNAPSLDRHRLAEDRPKGLAVQPIPKLVGRSGTYPEGFPNPQVRRSLIVGNGLQRLRECPVGEGQRDDREE